MNKVGSLSPRLRALIEEKTEGTNILKLPKLGSKKLSSRSIQRSEFDRSHTTKPKQNLFLPEPESVTTIQTVRELLTKEPIADRFDYMDKHYIEFMSYLRPILKDNINTSAENSGWGFLTKHVCCNIELFREVLKERNRLEALQMAQEEYNKRMQK